MAAVVVLGSLEHDVLEQVGKAGAAHLLILGANVVPDVDSRDGNSVVLVEDHVQAVGQGYFIEGDGGHEKYSFPAVNPPESVSTPAVDSEQGY